MSFLFKKKGAPKGVFTHLITLNTLLSLYEEPLSLTYRLVMQFGWYHPLESGSQVPPPPLPALQLQAPWFTLADGIMRYLKYPPYAYGNETALEPFPKLLFIYSTAFWDLKVIFFFYYFFFKEIVITQRQQRVMVPNYKNKYTSFLFIAPKC